MSNPSNGDHPSTNDVAAGVHYGEAVRIDIRGDCAYLVMDRPEQRNSVTLDMVLGLRRALEHLERRQDIRVVVLSGAGDRFFCPGADLDASSVESDGEPELPAISDLRIPVLLHSLPQVTIAAINGACAGAGLGWATACDLRFASTNAVFSAAFLDVGVAGDMGLPWTLSSIVGGARAREILFLTGKFDANQALQFGLVSEVLEALEFRSEIATRVKKLLNYSPDALRTLKANFLASERLGLADYVDLEHERHFDLVTAPAFQEAAREFVGRRS